MIRTDEDSQPEQPKKRQTPELDMAARVADRAGEDVAVDELPPDEQQTWGRADANYRRALDEIAFLVDMRREAAEIDVVAEVAKSTPMPVEPRDTWGPFEILERLGGGASGDVYKVRDKHLKNHVALKLFHRERVASVELDTLLVEGRQHALVKHPNIAVIHGADENDGRVGIWMEYIDGSTLQELVQEQGNLGAAEAVNVARELCSALAAVHQQGLTHGDIKAQNVMREKGGRVVLMDFSSARHVELDDDASGGLVGTPIYMAPELFDDRASDFRSDIYALGVLLFFLVTGRHPYEAKNLKELRVAVSSQKPLLLDDLRADLPSEFVRAVHKAISWAPEDRFQSAGEFQAALRVALAPEASENVLPYHAQTTPDLSVLVRAARVVTWSVLVTSFLALLGYANEFQFNVVLHVPDTFTNYSPVHAIAIGLRSLVISLGLLVLEAGAFAVVWGLLVTLSPRTAEALRERTRRIVGKIRRADFNRLATGFVLVCIVAFASACLMFGDLLALPVQIAEAGSLRGIDTSILANNDYHVRFFLVFTQIAIVTVLGWVGLFNGVARPTQLSSSARLMKGLSTVVIVVGLLLMASLWRLLWKNESQPVWIGDTKGYVVAISEDKQNWFVYIPDAVDATEHLVINKADPRITRMGDKNETLFIDS